MHNYSDYIVDNLEYLQKLSKTKSIKKKKDLLLKATSDQILAIVEIIVNVLKSNYILSKRQKTKLSKNADYYRAIARSRTEKTARKRIQEGGGPELAILVPILSVLADQLMKKVL